MSTTTIPAATLQRGPPDTLKRSLSHGQMTMIVMGSALGTASLGSGTIAMAGPRSALTYAGSALAW